MFLLINGDCEYLPKVWYSLFLIHITHLSLHVTCLFYFIFFSVYYSYVQSSFLLWYLESIGIRRGIYSNSRWNICFILFVIIFHICYYVTVSLHLFCPGNTKILISLYGKFLTIINLYTYLNSSYNVECRLLIFGMQNPLNPHEDSFYVLNFFNLF